MFKTIWKTKTTRRRSRRWQRQIEYVRECMKYEDYKKKIQKMKITKDVPTEIDDEDVRQMFQNILWHIESY